MTLMIDGTRTLFPKLAPKRVRIKNAWHPEKTQLTAPEPGGFDGWVVIEKDATAEQLLRLKESGYTHVDLVCGSYEQPSVMLDRLQFSNF